MEKIPDIFNNVTYKHANIQFEIICIVGYTKMTKSDKIWRFENIHTQIDILVIFM
jgi:hypothetical protein